MPMTMLINEEAEKLREEVKYWRRFFCAIALSAGGEVRVAHKDWARVVEPGSKTTFETFEDSTTHDRVFRVIEEQSIDATARVEAQKD